MESVTPTRKHTLPVLAAQVEQGDLVGEFKCVGRVEPGVYIDARRQLGQLGCRIADGLFSVGGLFRAPQSRGGAQGYNSVADEGEQDGLGCRDWVEGQGENSVSAEEEGVGQGEEGAGAVFVLEDDRYRVVAESADAAEGEEGVGVRLRRHRHGLAGQWGRGAAGGA